MPLVVDEPEIGSPPQGWEEDSPMGGNDDDDDDDDDDDEGTDGGDSDFLAGELDEDEG
jgi:hypothetical protein